MITHTYIDRAKCDCGFLWTNEGSEKIACKCGGSTLMNGTLMGVAMGKMFTEAEFKTAVSEDIGIPEADLIVEEYQA